MYGHSLEAYHPEWLRLFLSLSHSMQYTSLPAKTVLNWVVKDKMRMHICCSRHSIINVQLLHSGPRLHPPCAHPWISQGHRFHVLAAPLSFQPGQAVEDGPKPWNRATTQEIQKKLLTLTSDPLRNSCCSLSGTEPAEGRSSWFPLSL